MTFLNRLWEFCTYINKHFKGLIIYPVLRAILYRAAFSRFHSAKRFFSFHVEAIENSLTHRTAPSLKSCGLVYINMIPGRASITAIPAKLLWHAMWLLSNHNHRMYHRLSLIHFRWGIYTFSSALHKLHLDFPSELQSKRVSKHDS